MPEHLRPVLRIAVVGHVEHVTIGRAPSLPPPGGIAHLSDAIWIPGGGGGVAFHQLIRSSGEIHLFTAIGNDDAGRAVSEKLAATEASIYAVRRDEPHTRDLCVITPEGERTIFVIGEPLHPERRDLLPWEVLGVCDAAYFTAQDPDSIREARRARTLVVTARRGEALARSGVGADIVVGSARDPREASTLADYPVAPGALVMTEGGAGGYVETQKGRQRFPPGVLAGPIISSYGAGDSFAGALTWYVARGLPVLDACRRASAHGAAVLTGQNPLESQLALE